MKNEERRRSCLSRALSRLRRYRHNYRSRKQLLQLDEHALKDIGLTRGEAIKEGRKPFWNCTTHQETERLPVLQPMALVSLFVGISLIILFAG